MRIRQATRDDLKSYAVLLAEMERHYGAEPDEARVFTRLADRFETYADLVYFVAENEDGIVGHATMSPLFLAGNTSPAYFIKDVYVTSSMRGQSVGEALLKACASEAKARGGWRLDLTVDENNPQAARLYERMGAVDTKKRYLRWDGEAFDCLAEGDVDG